MRREYSVYEAKARLSELLREVRAEGREIVITYRGRRIAKIVPCADEVADSLDARVDALAARGLLIPAAEASKSIARGSSARSKGALRRFLENRE